MEQEGNKIYIGVDFGGTTTITAGAVEERELIVLKTVPTRRERSPEDILESIAQVVREVAENRPIGGRGHRRSLSIGSRRG